MGRNYSRKEDPKSSDLSLIWDSQNADWKLSPFSAIATLISSLLPKLDTAEQEPVSQYLTPSDGFSLTLEGTENLHLILTPSGTLTSGTVLLPISPGTRNKQKVVVTTSQQITDFSVGGNGAALVGAPSTLLSGAFFTMAYDMDTNTWYRVA